jgi:hypothetical protein
MNWLKKLLLGPQKLYNHRLNYTERTWTLEDGTPMARFSCSDCDHRGEGHVHAIEDYKKTYRRLQERKIVYTE